MDNENINNKITYNGKIEDLVSILFFNLMLNLFTIGIYSFWGRVNIREYIAESVSIGKFSFKYTGTGGELFKGVLYVLPPICIIAGLLSYSNIIFHEINSAIFNNLFSLISPIGGLVTLFDKILNNFNFELTDNFVPGVLKDMSYVKFPHYNNFYLILFYAFNYIFFIIGSIAALKYRISRVNFNNISARAEISTIKYTINSIKYLFLNFISFGILIPYSDIQLKKYVINNLYYGPNIFKFVEKEHELDSINIITLLLVIPTFGISRFWYQAALIRYMYNCVELNNIKFKNTQTGEGIMWLYISNAIILSITLNFGQAFVQHRAVKFFTNNLEIIGDLNELEFSESDMIINKKRKYGEGIAQGFIDGSDISNWM